MSHTVEAYKHIASGEHSGGHVELLTICTYGVGHIAIVGEPSWSFGHNAVCGFVERERISYVTVKRFVPRLAIPQPPYLPAGGNVDIRPCCIVIVNGAHSVGGFRRCVHPLEFPDAVERLEVGRESHVVLYHICLTGHRQSNRVSWLSVHTCHLWVIPFLSCLSKRGGDGGESYQAKDDSFHDERSLMDYCCGGMTR